MGGVASDAVHHVGGVGDDMTFACIVPNASEVVVVVIVGFEGALGQLQFAVLLVDGDAAFDSIVVSG